MNPERKRYLNLTVVMAILAVSVLPNLSKDTGPALGALVSDASPDCTQIGLADEIVIAVPGSGSFIQDGKKMPDLAEELRLQAAAEYYRQNKSRIKEIILLDGNSDPKGENFNKKRLLEIESTIPQDKIKSEQKSINTATNMDALKGFVSDSIKTVIITSKSHLQRAVYFACAKGIKAIGIAAHEVHTKETLVKEKLELLLAILFDRQGWIPTLLKKVL